MWDSFARDRLTLFMAVPTQYYRLIQAWERGRRATQREAWSRAARGLRLMVSGSAALPERVLARWREITGHVLLERYGMTETGMILSNPLHGERIAGDGGLAAARRRGAAGRRRRRGAARRRRGELWVRGPAVFDEYWRRPDATAAAFAGDWFRTGDVARRAGGVYRLLGRASVDILKTGGYKVSALEIEEVLRAHPAVEDARWSAWPTRSGASGWRRRWCRRGGATPTARRAARVSRKERLAPYKAPRECCWSAALPRNTLGKVEKPRVKRLFTAER